MYKRLIVLDKCFCKSTGVLFFNKDIYVDIFIFFVLQYKNVHYFVLFLQSDKIYTVIKTSPMWRNVQGRKEAVFKVNQKAHLLSLLTMIGPSPDWCIGMFIAPS
jgi:hypothetical protein